MHEENWALHERHGDENEIQGKGEQTCIHTDGLMSDTQSAKVAKENSYLSEVDQFMQCPSIQELKRRKK